MSEIEGHRLLTETGKCECGHQDGLTYVEHKRELYFWVGLEPTPFNLAYSAEYRTHVLDARGSR